MPSFLLRLNRKEIVMIRSLSVAVVACGLGSGMLACHSPYDKTPSEADYGPNTQAGTNNPAGPNNPRSIGPSGSTDNENGIKSGPSGTIPGPEAGGRGNGSW
jgi:hypothetical protein